VRRCNRGIVMLRSRSMLLLMSLGLALVVSTGTPAGAAKPSRSFTKDFYSIFYQDCDGYTASFEFAGTDIFTVSVSGDRVRLVQQGIGRITVTNLSTLETVHGVNQIRVATFLDPATEFFVGQLITDHVEVSGLNATFFIEGHPPLVVSGRALADITYVVTGFDGAGSPLFQVVDVQEQFTPNMSHLSPLICGLVA
jgi:hypothetical protein